MKRRHRHARSALQLEPDGSTRFRLWAPDARRVTLDVESTARRRSCRRSSIDVGEGWYELERRRLGAGAKYRYRIDDEIDVPDPASRFNPDGVQAQARSSIRERSNGAMTAWRGRAVARGGDLRAARRHVHAAKARTPRSTARLDELAELGHHGARADAAGDLSGRARLGLRRRAALSRRTRRTGGPRI